MQKTKKERIVQREKFWIAEVANCWVITNSSQLSEELNQHLSKYFEKIYTMTCAESIKVSDADDVFGFRINNCDVQASSSFIKTSSDNTNTSNDSNNT